MLTKDIKNLEVGSILFYMWEKIHKKEFAVIYIDRTFCSSNIYLRERYAYPPESNEYYLYDKIYRLDLDGNMYCGEFIMIHKEDLIIDSQNKHVALPSESATTLSSFFQKLIQ